jgi:hypothetical protein
MLKTVAKVIATGYVAAGCRNAQVMLSHANGRLVGVDSFHVCADGRGIVMVTIVMPQPLSRDFGGRVRQRIVELAVREPQNPLFTQVSGDRYEQLVLDTQRARDEFAARVVCRQELPSWNEWDMGDLACKVFWSKHMCWCVVNHAVMDGMAASRMCFNVLFDTTTKMFQIPFATFSYRPLLTEWVAIQGMSQLLRLPPRSLREMDWKIRLTNHEMHLAMATDMVTRFKNDAMTSFPVGVASLILARIFATVPEKPRLNIAMIVAFSNKMGFNNYGVVAASIERSTCPKTIAREMTRKISRGRAQALASYVYTNMLDLNVRFFEAIDCNFSIMPISQTPLYIDGMETRSTHITSVASAPICVFVASCGPRVDVSVTCNTPDVDPAVLATHLRPLCRAKGKVEHACIPLPPASSHPPRTDAAPEATE